MKLAEGIYLVASGRDGVYLTDELDCNCYLIDFHNTLALFDCGIGIRPGLLEEQVRGHGFSMEQISYLFLTHCHGDHMGAAAYFQKKYGIQVIAPETEAKAMELGDETALGLDIARAAGFYPADYELNACRADGMAVPGLWRQRNVSLKVFEASGHSPGGVCYYGSVEGKRFLIVGDLVKMGGKISFQLIPGADIHAYARCVKNLRDLEVDLFLPGHGLFQLKDGGRQMRLAAEAFEHLFIPT